MSKKPSETKKTTSENDELFGHLSDEDRIHADLTDEELAGMEEDDEDEDEAGGEDEAEGADESNDDDDGGDENDTDSDDDDEETNENKDDDSDDGGAGEDDDDADDEDEDGGTGHDAAALAKGEKTEETDEDESEYEDDPLLDTRSVMPDEWALPEKARERVAEMDQEIADLASKFDEGELTASDYRQQSAKLDDERMTLKMQIREAEQSFSKAMTHWEKRTVKKFLKDHPEWSASQIRLQALDAEVRRLQKASNDPFDPRILLKAHRSLVKEFGGAAPAAKKPIDGKKSVKKPNPVPAGQKSAIPPTLARVPADEISDTKGGKFKRLDHLSEKSPDAFQDALAKMSKAEREEYLRA